MMESATTYRPFSEIRDGASPHVSEFVDEVRGYVLPDVVILTDVHDAQAGRVDVVLVGPDATVAVIFGRRGVPALPPFADVLYSVAATDVAHGVADILYVITRNHPSLFSIDAKLRLVPFCSSRILGHRARRRSVHVGQGDDGQPVVIRVLQRRAEESRPPREARQARKTTEVGSSV